MSILNTYLRDISRYQPLTIEQELTLGEQARAGNQQARKRLIERVYHNNERVEVSTYTSLTGSEAKRLGATTIIRSLRNATDFEYERTLDRINREIYPDLRTIFIIAPAEVEHISSSLVRELHAFNHDTRSLLPEGIVLAEYLTHDNK